MPSPPVSPKTFWRLAPDDDQLRIPADDLGSITNPREFIHKLRPRHGIVVARWDSSYQLSRVKALGVVRSIEPSYVAAQVDWRAAEIQLRPNPSGRRYWTQTANFFGFAKDVAIRYMLEDLFAEHFPEFGELQFGATPTPVDRAARRSSSPTGGYVYVIRSKHVSA